MGEIGFIPRAKRRGKDEIPQLILALANVMSSGRQNLRPFPYQPKAFDASKDELLTEKSYAIYDEMWRDATVRDALRASNSKLIQNWRATPSTEGDSAAEAVAEFCSYSLTRMTGGFLRRLRKVLNARRYGFSVQEQEREIIADGPWTGMVSLKDWHYRLPHFLEPRRDEKTGEVSIYQRQPDKSEKRLPLERAVYFTWLDDLDILRGEGDLRAAYRYWWTKDTLIKLVAIHMEMVGTGRPSIGWDPEVVKELSATDIEHAQKIVQDFQTALGVLLLPGMTFDILEGTPAADHYLRVLEYLDEEIRKVIGKPKLLSEQDGDTGSHALVREQSGQHAAEMGELQNDLEELIPEQVFKPLLRFNAIPMEYLPGFSLAPPREEDRQAKADAFLAGVQGGVVQVREGDEAWYRMMVDAPPLEEAGAPLAAQGQPESAGAFPQLGSSTLALSEALFGRQYRPTVSPVDKTLLRFNRERDLFRELDALSESTREQLHTVWARMLWKLHKEVETQFIEGDLNPVETLQAIRELTLDPAPLAKARAASARNAYAIGKKFGQEEMDRIVGRRYAATPVNPSGTADLGNFWGLVQSRSFTWAERLANTVLQRLRGVLEIAFDRGEGYPESRKGLADTLNELAGGNLIGPGANPPHTFDSPQIQLTTLRTLHADSADRAKLDLYERNNQFVLGIERIEFIEEDRNHPLSPAVEGLKIPLDHPLLREFVGALHYNERGGTRPITAREVEKPGFRWSTEAQIQAALRKKRRLSPRFRRGNVQGSRSRSLAVRG